MPVDLISYLYAATVAAGGIAGYVKAGNFNHQKKKIVWLRCRQMFIKWINLICNS